MTNLNDGQVSLTMNLEVIANILNTVSTPAIVLDNVGKIVHFNTTMERVSGYTNDEVQNWFWWDAPFVSKDTLELSSEQFLLHKFPDRLQTLWTTKEGGERSIEWQIKPHHRSDGSLEYVIATGYDTTEQRKTEDALVRSEALYHDLARNFPNGAILVFDHDLRYLLVEGSEVSNVGLNKELMLGKTMYEVFPPEVAAMNEPICRATLAGQSFTAEGVYGDATYDVRFLPLRDQDGKIIAGLSISQNITERKKVENALRRSESLYRGLARNFPNGAIIVFDHDLRYQLIEGAEVKEVGIERDVLLGKTLSESFPAEIANTIEPLLRKTLNGETTVTESSFLDRTYQAYYVPVYDDDGKVIAGLSISQNITKRVEAEKELEQSLSNEKRARREAQEAVRMKDMFLATMSHELRTPLNAMIGFLHLMLFSEQLDDDNTHMVERTIANSQRLLNLINNILDISRIASGGLQLVPVKMSPAELAKTIHDDFSLQAKERGIQLTYSVAEDLPETIIHDEERLGQVILNLVGNAIKFTIEGGIDLELTRNAENLVIKVRDTGIGMPPSRQHVIFDDFVQLDNTTTRKHQGAGLGLSIVKRLTLLMKGSVTVTSEVGKGSIFIVEVPLDLVKAE